MIGGERHAAVGQGADVSGLEGAAGPGEHHGLGRLGDALRHGGEEVLAVQGGADAAVGVGPFHRDALAGGVGLLDRRGGAEASCVGAREDDVGAVTEDGVVGLRGG